jgi:hypothetical protein
MWLSQGIFCSWPIWTKKSRRKGSVSVTLYLLVSPSRYFQLCDNILREYKSIKVISSTPPPSNIVE